MTDGASTRFEFPGGTLELRRYPTRRRELLQAWSAADRLLLKMAADLSVDAGDCLVLNDDFGALSLGLGGADSWTDSWLAAEGLRRNAVLNELPQARQWFSRTAPDGAYRCIVSRVPKQLALLEWQLRTMAPRLASGTTLLVAGMDKHLPPSLEALLERCWGPTERHRAHGKARHFSASLAVTANTPLDSDSFYCEPLGVKLTTLPNVFSNTQLDIGSRFLIEQLPGLDIQGHVADVACGCGVLGIAAGRIGRPESLLFCDESDHAISSAQANAQQYVEDHIDVSYHHGDGLLGYDGNPFDLILCNPPFHLGHSVNDYAGRRLLQGAAEHLVSGGRLVAVANRHLDYGPGLKRAFRRVDTIAQNRKFIVWQAMA